MKIPSKAIENAMTEAEIEAWVKERGALAEARRRTVLGAVKEVFPNAIGDPNMGSTYAMVEWDDAVIVATESEETAGEIIVEIYSLEEWKLGNGCDSVSSHSFDSLENAVAFMDDITDFSVEERLI